MAWRDSRASRRRLLLFSLSVVFGIAALVALGSFSTSLAYAVRTQTKDLLGADLFVVSRPEMGAAVTAYLDALGGEQARDVSFSSMMVFPGDGEATRLVQVRAMEGNFPFYGDFVTDPSDAVARLRRAASETSATVDGVPQNVVILEDTLLAQFDVKVGDQVKLGRSQFTVIGALKKDSGRIDGGGDASTARFYPFACTGSRRAGGERDALLSPDGAQAAARERPGSDRPRYAREIRRRAALVRHGGEPAAGTGTDHHQRRCLSQPGGICRAPARRDWRGEFGSRLRAAEAFHGCDRAVPGRERTAGVRGLSAAGLRPRSLRRRTGRGPGSDRAVGVARDFERHASLSGGFCDLLAGRSPGNGSRIGYLRALHTAAPPRHPAGFTAAGVARG